MQATRLDKLTATRAEFFKSMSCFPQLLNLGADDTFANAKVRIQYEW